MPNKYIRHGATFNGDGTTSAEAASNGAAGAWNSITIFEGTSPSALPGAAGTLAAGDVVYIRSKDEAGAALSYTLAGDKTLGAAAAVATVTAPITWIFDAGTNWPGIDGDVTYTSPGSGWDCTVRAYNHIKHDRLGGFILQNTATTPGDAQKIVDLLEGAVIENGKFLNTTRTDAGARFGFHVSDGSMLINPIIKFGLRNTGTSEYSEMFVFPFRRGEFTLINPDIELQSALAQSALFRFEVSYARTYNVFGGRLYGAGAGSSLSLAACTPGTSTAMAGQLRCVGFSVPRAVKVFDTSTPLVSMNASVQMIGCDGGFGGHLEERWGWATSRNDNNPPYLATEQPDSGSTPWSWRVYPDTADFLKPCKLTTSVAFTGAAAAQVITQEVLIANTMSPTKANTWITVEYIDDATGLPKHVNTRDATGPALDSSTAAWSATVWGLTTFVKRKLTITTPTTVKQNTPITVTFWTAMNSANADEILFVDPGFSVVPA